MNITLQPTVLRWARERAGLDAAALAKKLNTTPEKVAEWESEGTLTYKRAEKLAEKTHTPFGYLFLDTPPAESLPITDFRTVGSEEPARPSPELLDVLYDAMSKQAWYRDYLVEMGETRLDYIGSARLEEAPAEVAARIRERCGFESEARAQASDWKSALSLMFEQCEEHGILVTRTGTAKGNPHRPLKVEEFRGFALSDPYAPLIFINSRDSQAAQMFTLIHEVVHLWLGLSGVSNSVSTHTPISRVEQFCNQVAAEVLKISKSEGASHCSSKTIHTTSRPRFAPALIGSALEGRTPYREAYTLLGVRKSRTFDKLACQLDYPTQSKCYEN